MGDVGVATDPDVNSQYWDPASHPFTISPVRVWLSTIYALVCVSWSMTWICGLSLFIIALEIIQQYLLALAIFLLARCSWIQMEP